MRSAPFKPKAYLKEGCPFSFKFLLFASEAGIRDDLELIRCASDAPDFQAIKSRLEAALHKPATFPAVEVEPGRYLANSDKLIEYFARRSGIEPAGLAVLSFYVQTIFPQLLRLHQQSA